MGEKNAKPPLKNTHLRVKNLMYYVGCADVIITVPLYIVGTLRFLWLWLYKS
jgi:hypothetical protein